MAVAAGAAVGAAAFAGIASAGLVGADRGHASSPAPLIERAACATPAGDPPPDPGVAQQVSVAVRGTALLQLDGRGRVVAAWTNTGCAPRRSDDVYLQRPDGSIRSGGRDLTARRWTGDFREAGVLVPQITDRQR